MRQLCARRDLNWGSSLNKRKPYYFFFTIVLAAVVIAAVFVWMLPGDMKGSIIKVSDSDVYLCIGGKDGAAVGQELDALNEIVEFWHNEPNSKC